MMTWPIIITVNIAVLNIYSRILVDAYCYQGWTQERGKCYIVSNTNVTWQRAMRECDVLDAALVMLDDIAEQTFILQLKSMSTDVNHWIGYYRNGTSWKWLHALNTSINHLNTTNVHQDEQCAAITKLGVWNPTKCENQLPYICESKNQDCMTSQGWFDYESQCLNINVGLFSWTQARLGCKRMDADLAVMGNVYKNGAPLMQNGVTVWTWIGLKYDSMRSEYIWLDGTTSNIITDSSSVQRPNSAECMAMLVNETSQMVLTNGFPCNVKLQGLCEKILRTGQSTLSSKQLHVTTTSLGTRNRNQNITSTYSISNTAINSEVTWSTTGHVSDSHMNGIVPIAECLNGVPGEHIEDCLRDVFMSFKWLCSLDSQGPDHSSNLTNLFNIEFYKNLVQYFGNFIERNFEFSLCKRNNVGAFLMVEMILDQSYPRSNLSRHNGIQFQSEMLEIALHKLSTESDTHYNALFESSITGCVVNELLSTMNSNDVKIAFAVIDTGDVVQVDIDESVQNYLVSPVLIVSAYSGGTKTTVGHTFTLAYHSVDDIAENKQLNITKYEVSCTYYEPKRELWSKYGCNVLSVGPYTVTCMCNHTTSFGIIMKIQVFEMSRENEVALSVITYIGCSVSMVTMFIAMTVFTCIRSLNSERVFVHRNLCVAILCSQIVFIAAGKATTHKMVCRVTAVVLHYCFLSIFTWMLVEGLHLYTQVVQVFGTDKSRNSYYLCFGWGLPIILVLISSAADWEGYGTETSCWLSIDRKTIWAFVGPAVAVIVVNFVVLVMVLRVVVSSAKTSRPSKAVQTRTAIKAALFLLHLLGLTWIFGLLAVNRQMIVFEYIFSLCNSLQGFFVFLFHCILNTEVRQALRRLRERRAALNEDNQTVSFSTDSDTSSVAVEGTLRFRLSYNAGWKKSHKQYQNSWLTAEKLKHEGTITEGTLIGQTQKSEMSFLRRSINSKDKPQTGDQADNLPIIYI